MKRSSHFIIQWVLTLVIGVLIYNIVYTIETHHEPKVEQKGRPKLTIHEAGTKYEEQDAENWVFKDDQQKEDIMTGKMGEYIVHDKITNGNVHVYINDTTKPEIGEDMTISDADKNLTIRHTKINDGTRVLVYDTSGNYTQRIVKELPDSMNSEEISSKIYLKTLKELEEHKRHERNKLKTLLRIYEYDYKGDGGSDTDRTPIGTYIDEDGVVHKNVFTDRDSARKLYDWYTEHSIKARIGSFYDEQTGDELTTFRHKRVLYKVYTDEE